MNVLRIPKDKDFLIEVPLATKDKNGESNSLSVSAFTEQPTVTLISSFGNKSEVYVEDHKEKTNCLVAEIKANSSNFLFEGYNILVEGEISGMYVSGISETVLQIIRDTVTPSTTQTKYTLEDGRELEIYTLSNTTISSKEGIAPTPCPSPSHDPLYHPNLDLLKNFEKRISDLETKLSQLITTINSKTITV